VRASVFRAASAALDVIAGQLRAPYEARANAIMYRTYSPTSHILVTGESISTRPSRPKHRRPESWPIGTLGAGSAGSQRRRLSPPRGDGDRAVSDGGR